MLIDAPRLSLCMIVKNEEDCMDRCLNSIKDVVDEIVIVDTGSTDRTVGICRNYQARILPFPWNGSFSDARNHGIEHASGEWILWLDADEEVDGDDRHRLLDTKAFKDFDVLTIRLVNYYGETADRDRTTDIKHTRLFRKNAGIRFINKIHECLDIVNLHETRIGHLDLRVHHYGYLDPIVKNKGKFERNLNMLKQQLLEHENPYWAYYYIASEYYRNGQMQEAFDHVNKSISAFLKEQLLPPSMVYKLKYMILISMGSFSGAWPGIERAIALYPDYVDLRFFMGVILYHLEMYDSAMQAFGQCLEMGEDNIDHLILRGVGSFQAQHYIGLCLLKLERPEEAAISCLRSLVYAPNYEPARKSLADLESQLPLPLSEMIDQYFGHKEASLLKEALKFEN